MSAPICFRIGRGTGEGAGLLDGPGEGTSDGPGEGAGLLDGAREGTSDGPGEGAGLLDGKRGKALDCLMELVMAWRKR